MKNKNFKIKFEQRTVKHNKTLSTKNLNDKNKILIKQKPEELSFLLFIHSHFTIDLHIKIIIFFHSLSFITCFQG